MVLSVGFEPTILAEYAPEAYAYASSATKAKYYILTAPEAYAPCPDLSGYASSATKAEEIFNN